MPYYNRESLEYTLLSFKCLYEHRHDFEVIVVEEKKNVMNDEYHSKLMNIISIFNEIMSIQHLTYLTAELFNPSPLFNLGVDHAKGQYMVLTNPECYHAADILQGFDEEFDKNSNCYVVCSCINVIQCASKDFVQQQWLQHSIHNNRLLHFCSCISRENYIKIGGFDEEYAKGIAYDDDDFRNTVQINNIQIIPRDDLLIYHISHDVKYQYNVDLWNVNAKYYVSKWQR